MDWRKKAFLIISNLKEKGATKKNKILTKTHNERGPSKKGRKEEAQNLAPPNKGDLTKRSENEIREWSLSRIHKKHAG